MTPSAPRGTVAVVGGAGDIGSAIARRFVSAGWSVAVADRDSARASRLEVELGASIRCFAVDVLDEGSIASLAADLRQAYAGLDHLVSLAGGSLPGEYRGLDALTPQMLHGSIDLNLKSHLFLARALVPLMERPEEPRPDRSITFVSSINAVRDFGLPAYSAAKAGLLGMARPLATELGPRQIRVNVLLPGTVQTARTSRLPRRLDETRRNGTALLRFASPEEIAQVAWAMAQIMTCVTGQGIVADCGQSMRGYPMFPD